MARQAAVAQSTRRVPRRQVWEARRTSRHPPPRRRSRCRTWRLPTLHQRNGLGRMTQFAELGKSNA
eukprot:796591-Prymnesium_polylepis.2